jgi:hypothetical protein
MMGDHPDRQDMILSGEHPDPKTASMSEWSQWVEKNYPYDERWRLHLLTRQRKPVVGSRAELDDLRGLLDRSMAADMARLWFHLGTPEWEKSYLDAQRFKAKMAAAAEAKRLAGQQEEPQGASRSSKRGRTQQWEDRP